MSEIALVPFATFPSKPSNVLLKTAHTIGISHSHCK